VGDQFIVIIFKDTPSGDINSGSQPHRRWLQIGNHTSNFDESRVRGAESAICVVPDDSTIDILSSSFQMRFGLVSECCIWWYVQSSALFSARR
jgi:hypothetical protein